MILLNMMIFIAIAILMGLHLTWRVLISVKEIIQVAAPLAAVTATQVVAVARAKMAVIVAATALVTIPPPSQMLITVPVFRTRVLFSLAYHHSQCSILLREKVLIFMQWLKTSDLDEIKSIS